MSRCPVSISLPRSLTRIAIDRLWFGLALAAQLLVGSSGALASYEELSAARIIAIPDMPRPGYLQPAVDPVFGTHFTRVTDPGAVLMPGVVCHSAYCTHRYSSSQAWNADQSLLLITNGCDGFCFLNGQTYQPLFRRNMANECEWHPVDPKLMICVYRNIIYTWAPRTNENTIVYMSTDYRNLQFGPYKGNPSSDGRRLVVRAINSAGELVAFAYDIAEKKKFADIAVGKLPGKNGFCSIAPSGRLIFCFQTLQDENEAEVGNVFTLDGVQIQRWTEHHRPGHGDMTVDADGSDVYVGISKSEPDKFHIIKRRLEDGAVTDLVHWGDGQHASIRNIRRPGWVFVTYTGNYSEITENPEMAPFYQEVIALRIDGSGEMRRIAQTRDAKFDYWSESHASPSPDGSQVIWSSNWGTPGAPVADYVTRLSWPDKVTQKQQPN